MNLLQFADLHPWWSSLWLCWSLSTVGGTICFCVDARAQVKPRRPRRGE